MLSEGYIYIAGYSVEIFSDTFLHDPHYFAMNKNPVTIPKKRLTSLKADGFTTVYVIHLGVTKISQLNTPDNICEENPKENFISCLNLYYIKVASIFLLACRVP